MRYWISSAIAVVFCIGLFLNAAMSAPTPWSDPHAKWTRNDERLLESQLPGGRFISTYTYLRCEKDGRLVMYHADGLTRWDGRTCWDWRRWISREVSP